MRFPAIALLVGLLVACSGAEPDTRLAAGGAFRTPAPATTPSASPPPRSVDPTVRSNAALTPCSTDATVGLPGKWRPSSVSLLADRGSVASPSIASVAGLCLEVDKTWRYGTASGTWSTAPIDPSDWKRWSVPASADEKNKIVLAGWAGGTADGPIEATGDEPHVVWVITRVGPPDFSGPGTLSIAFSR